jgi:hypothetical protein
MPASLDWNKFSASTYNPMIKIFAWGKRLLLKQIQKQLKKFDQHLVPSTFMEEYVRKNYGQKVITLPHFIQE